MNQTLTRILRASAIGSVALGTLALSGTAFAAGFPGPHRPGDFGGPMVMGTVATAPDGNGTFTVTARAWQRDKNPSTETNQAETTTTYTVTTTSGTTVMREAATSTVSAIAAGDHVMVRGTKNGTTVAATMIRDLPAGTTPPEHPILPQGNGAPVVGGTIASISGSSFTVTNNGSATYTVDASSATITKPGTQDATMSTLAVGDAVVVQGTVQGTSITATSVVDQGTHGNDTNGDRPKGPHGGFFGFLGGLFGRLFGFF